MWSTHTAFIEGITFDSTGRPVYNTVDGNWGDKVVRRSLTTDNRGKIFAVIAPAALS